MTSQLVYEYDTKIKEFNFLVSTYPEQYTWISNKDVIKTLLAMSIYYNQILANIESASTFHHTVRNYSQGGDVIIGDFLLNETQVARIEEINTEFARILDIFNMDIYLFDYYTVKNFLEKFRKHIDREMNDNEKL